MATRGYNRNYFAKLTTAEIDARWEAARDAVKADEGKLYRGYKFQAQLQRINHLQMLTAVKADREAGLI